MSGRLPVNGADLGEVIKEERSYYSDNCVLMSGLESGEGNLFLVDRNLFLVD